MAYYLGNNQFTFFRRNDERGAAPELLSEQKTILRRPGTDGTSVRHEGQAGEPFSMRSMRDFESVDEALSAMDTYKDFERASQPYTLVWNDVNYASEYGVKYVILRVGDYNLVRIRNVTGVARVTANPGWKLEATWVLLPVKKPAEQETEEE